MIIFHDYIGFQGILQNFLNFLKVEIAKPGNTLSIKEMRFLGRNGAPS